MKLRFSTLAREDLRDIGDFIARDNHKRARSFIEDIQRQCDRIAEQPQLYPARLEISTSMKSCAFGRYIIFFSLDESGSQILVHRILHSAMDIGKHLPAGSTPNMLSQNIASYL